MAKSEGVKLRVILQPKQEQLLALMETGRAEIIGYGGARGGSKSHGVRAVNLARRIKYPVTSSLVFRRTYPELLNNHILPTFRDWPALRQFYRQDEKTIHFPNGSLTSYLSADDERGFARLQGAEFADEFIDEASHNEEEKIVWLRTMLRCTTNRDIVPKQVLTMNPGGIGHAYVKRVFIDKAFRGNERPEDYAFLQAHGHDNVEWSRPALEQDGFTDREYYSWPEEKRFQYFITRSQYGRNLNALPGRLRDANLLGRWDVFEGQYFDLFDEESNTVDFDQYKTESKAWNTRWISGDWGFNDDTVIHWHEVDGEGLITTYREMVTNRTTPEDIGHLIVQANGGEEMKFFAFSPDAFAKRTSTRTVADEVGDVLVAAGLPPPMRADDDRIGGWQLMYQLLSARKWRMTRNCKTLAQSLPLLQQHPIHVNDVADSPVDHAPDAARYGLKTYLGDVVEPDEVKIQRRITAPLDEPTDRMMQWQRAKYQIERPMRRRMNPRRFF